MIRQILRLPSRAVRKCLDFANPTLVRMGAGNRIIARVYYGLLNPNFGHEQMVFLAGCHAYKTSLTRPEDNLPLLRRNVHRIEKGLLMRPRRVPFALEYIDETVSAFATAHSVPAMDPKELQWAYDVLQEYFAVVPTDIEPLWGSRELFSSCTPPIGCGGERLIPYHRDIAGPPPVSYDDLMRLAIRRRSVRWFLKKPVPRDLIDQAIELCGQAPSACNRQPFEFRVIDDSELLKKVISIPFGLAGYGENVPCIAVIVGKQRNYFLERDRHLIYIDGSLAAMSFIFALESLGLSSCCVNWPDIASNDEKMATALELQPDERPIMLVALGYPDPTGLVARSAKKSLSRLRRYNIE